jgi:hypothetical protein
VRLDELIGRHPGKDRVVLRILGLNGRDATALELAERVDCCSDLVEGMIRELGEEGVRVRSAQPSPSPQEDAPPSLAVAGAAWPATPSSAGLGVALASG